MHPDVQALRDPDPVAIARRAAAFAKRSESVAVALHETLDTEVGYPPVNAYDHDVAPSDGELSHAYAVVDDETVADPKGVGSDLAMAGDARVSPRVAAVRPHVHTSVSRSYLWTVRAAPRGDVVLRARLVEGASQSKDAR